MKILEVTGRTPDLINWLLEVWEAGDLISRKCIKYQCYSQRARYLQ